MEKPCSEIGLWVSRVCARCLSQGIVFPYLHDLSWALCPNLQIVTTYSGKSSYGKSKNRNPKFRDFRLFSTFLKIDIFKISDFRIFHVWSKNIKKFRSEIFSFASNFFVFSQKPFKFFLEFSSLSRLSIPHVFTGV